MSSLCTAASYQNWYCSKGFQWEILQRREKETLVTLKPPRVDPTTTPKLVRIVTLVWKRRLLNKFYKNGCKERDWKGQYILCTGCPVTFCTWQKICYFYWMNKVDPMCITSPRVERSAILKPDVNGSNLRRFNPSIGRLCKYCQWI